MSRMILFAILAIPMSAQDSRGTFAGRVVDPQSRGVAGAQVTIRNVETGIDTVLITNERRAYAASLLIPGSYQIEASHTGFKKFSRRGIGLSSNDNLQIHLKLDLGHVTQTVDVTDPAPLIGGLRRADVLQNHVLLA